MSMPNRSHVFASVLLVCVVAEAVRPAYSGGQGHGGDGRVVPRSVMSADDARLAVNILDDGYKSILRAVHDAYPTEGGRAPVAATLVRKVQMAMNARGWPNSHFLGVNAILMNPDHRAHDAWEAAARRRLAAGEDRIEELQGGYLRIATSVQLGGRCTSCHWAAGSGSYTKAAITWRVPATGDLTPSSGPVE